jgi:hypothetical protein
MSAAENLLVRLKGVRITKPGKWKALCPAHPDKNPSLSITREIDGRVLVKCLAHCETQAVLSSVGLEFRDLYEKPLGHHFQPIRQDWHLREALAALASEATIIVIGANDVAAGKRLSDTDVTQMAKSAGRIDAAYRRLYGY